MENFSPYILGRRWFTWDRQYRCRARRPSHSGMGWHILSLPLSRRRIDSTSPVSTRSCGGQASAKSGRRSHVGNPSGLEKGIAFKQRIQIHFYPVSLYHPGKTNDLNVPATCSLPSRVLWMVTHLVGVAPFVVMAEIRLSNSSRFSFSFLTRDSIALLLNVSDSPPYMGKTH